MHSLFKTPVLSGYEVLHLGPASALFALSQEGMFFDMPLGLWCGLARGYGVVPGFSGGEGWEPKDFFLSIVSDR